MESKKLLHPQSLESEGYVLECSFSHQDLVAFILPFMKHNNRFIVLYKAGTYLPFLVLLGTLGYMLGSGTGKMEYLSAVFYAFGAALLLIPIHEVIHGIAYKLLGAPKVSYGVVWKKLVFYAQADRFLMGYKQFMIVALAPFIVIGLSLVIAMIFSNTQWAIFFLTVLTIHNGLCAGDFALMSYFFENRDKEMLTYDDEAEGKTYFYQKRSMVE
jgi:hypothetical protein